MTQSLDCNHAVGRSIQVTAGEGELFTYVYNADDPQYESPRPYFHPMRTLTGDLVTVYRPWDHLWHKGLSWSLPHFGHDNFWGGPTFTTEHRYMPLDNNGSQTTTGSTRSRCPTTGSGSRTTCPGTRSPASMSSTNRARSSPGSRTTAGCWSTRPR